MSNDKELITEPVEGPGFTALDNRLAMEADVVANTFAIAPHRPNYILPLTYNFDSDFEDYAILGRTFTDEEIKLQISLKTPLARGLWRDSSIWFGYTQQSYWQLYAEDFASAPFRETNYQPEVYWEVPVSHELLGWRARLLRLGINHQSNGQPELLSRSWNRVVGEAVFDRGNFVGTVKAWHRLEEEAEDDDNPDIEDFMGRAQLGLSYKRGEQTFSVNVINNLRTSENRSGVEVNWTFPLVQQLKGYVQFYSGYGENMIDADNYTNRVGIGFSLNDWL
ncbi:MAG: phospholipase A [Pseudomonadota bacterium]